MSIWLMPLIYANTIKLWILYVNIISSTAVPSAPASKKRKPRIIVNYKSISIKKKKDIVVILPCLVFFYWYNVIDININKEP